MYIMSGMDDKALSVFVSHQFVLRLIALHLYVANHMVHMLPKTEIKNSVTFYLNFQNNIQQICFLF